jgi:hypothetical protein
MAAKEETGICELPFDCSLTPPSSDVQSSSDIQSFSDVLPSSDELPSSDGQPLILSQAVSTLDSSLSCNSHVPVDEEITPIIIDSDPELDCQVKCDNLPICPVCSKKIQSSDLWFVNKHIDDCLRMPSRF